MTFDSLISRKQWLQFFGVIMLVLIIPTLISNAVAASVLPITPPITSPITPPVSPTPTATPRISPTPTATPVVCIQNAQTVALSPSIQSGVPGTPLVYYLSVTNNNSQGCGITEFNLSTLVSTNWTGQVSNTILALEPNRTGTAGVVFTSPISAVPNTYPVSVIVKGPVAQISANAAYKVLASNPTPTATPRPTVSPTPTVRPTPTATPRISPTPTASATPTVRPTASATPTATPTPTIKPNNNPVISNLILPVGRLYKPYNGSISGYDLDVNDRLIVNVSGLPNSLRLGPCFNKVIGTRSVVNCSIIGTPMQAGIFGIQATIRDNRGGTTTKKSMIVIVPIFRLPPISL